MRKIGLLVLLLSLLLGQAVYAGSLNQQFAVPVLVVNTSFLNARSGPGPQYSVVATVTGGSELPVLGTNSGSTWYLVTTPVGSGWVDVSFTLPRGSFNNVPVIDVSPAATVAFSTPLTIGLPGSTPTTVVGGILGGALGAGERTRAVLHVNSVDLLTQPVNGSPIVGLLFRDDDADYAVVGRTIDARGVEWLQVVVPNLGTGWIEAPKMSTRLSSTFRTVVVVTAGPVDLTFSPGGGSMLFPPLQNGQEAFLVNTSGNFYQVELANGWTGWIPSSAVQIRAGTPSDPGITAAAAAVGVPVPVLDPGIIIVNTSFLNVRTGPGGHFGSIATVAGSTELTPVGVTPDGTWFLVRGSFGQGWVAQEFVVFRGTFSNIPIINNAF